jgi:membrane fusion protein (multidrug efflux system)
MDVALCISAFSYSSKLFLKQMIRKPILYNLQNIRTVLFISLPVSLFITSCAPNKEDNSTKEKFQVTNPIIADTIYTSEYVADIHSLQNVELRARVKGYIEKIYVDEGQPVKAGQLLFSISSQELQVP